MNSTDFLFFARLVLAVLCLSQPVPAQDAMEVDLLICGGDESVCAAAVQAARMGVKQIALVNADQSGVHRLFVPCKSESQICFERSGMKH